MGDLKENINLHHKQFIIIHLPSKVKSSFLLFLISSKIKKKLLGRLIKYVYTCTR